MRLSTLKGGVRDLVVEVPETDEVVHIQYRPGELTLEVSDAMRAAIDMEVEERVFLIFLDKVLVSWDLEEDIYDEETGEPTGEVVPLPCTAEGIKKVPAPFLALVMQAIGDDARPNPQTGGSSNGSSQQEDSPEESQTGISSFGLRGTTESHPGI